MYTGIIYKYTSPSGKHYIGRTKYPDLRHQQHRTSTYKSNSKFGRAIRKYGFDNFTYEVLVEIKTPTSDELTHALNDLEIHYINFFDSYNNGYNGTKGGYDTTYIHTPSNPPIESVYQYDEDDTYIREWGDIQQISYQLLIPLQEIREAIRNNTPLCGCYWTSRTC